jgi:curved DNA-binding protein CbpA
MAGATEVAPRQRARTRVPCREHRRAASHSGDRTPVKHVKGDEPTELGVYRVLQVLPAAETPVLKAAFRALARRYHPDGEVPDMTRMAVLNTAYALVRTAEMRQAYDRRRSGPRPVGPGFAANRVNVGPGLEPAPHAPFARAAERTGREAGPESPVMDFGRYLGWSLAQVARQDPDYLRWLSRHSAGLRFRNEIRRLLPNDPDLTRRSNLVA